MNYVFIPVHALAKFQFHMSITLGVTALQSSYNRKIDMYSKYRENKLQAITEMVINRMTHRVEISTIMLVMSRGVDH